MTASASHKQWEEQEGEREAKANTFAALNGWKRSWASFSLKQLAGLRDPHWWTIEVGTGASVLDHVIWFRKGRTPAALVTQPYGDAIEEARWIAARYGLAVVEAPVPKASWHLPGSTRFIVFTRADVAVRWLPEQQS